MKTTFKLAPIIVLMVIIMAGKSVSAIEKTKKFNESWPASGIENLQISNKFGEVKFKNDNNTNITINVVVTVESSSENKADDLLEKIQVKFEKSGTTVKAETIFESNFKGNNRFSIDYVINVPCEKNLDVTNKYGNVVVNQLMGNGKFDIQYGNITAVGLNGTDTKMFLAYGKGKIDQSGNIAMEIKYSNVTMGQTGNMKLNTKYSTLDVEKAKLVQAESGYDKFNFGEVISLNADSKYSHVLIGRLQKNLRIGTGYGGIKVENIDPGFESININNSYGQVSLGLSSVNYHIDAKCQYCGISYPTDRFKGNRIKENTSFEINGKVGTGGGTVKIESRYGEIKLGE